MSKMELWKAGNYVGEDKSEYYVLVSRHQGWNPLLDSNFDYIVEEMTKEGLRYEIALFTHWACGYIESILIHKDWEDSVAYGNERTEEMERYALLDEDRYSQMLYERAKSIFDEDREFWMDKAGLSDEEKAQALQDGYMPYEVYEVIESEGYLVY